MAETRIADAQFSFSLGVDSSRPTTIAGPNMPDGLARNALAWGTNCNVRGGGITQRTGWTKVCDIHDSTGLYQGGWMYEQTTGIPYLIVCISGKFLRIRVDTDNSIDDITGPVVFPADQPYYHFAQGLEFMVTQAGDYVTLPAFWDGVTMRQSNGLTGVVGGQPGAVYTLPIGTYFTVPAVGNTVLVTLTSAVPVGIVIGNTGTIGTIGTYEVTNVAGNTLTIETISSDVIGSSIPPSTLGFTVSPGAPPANINEIPAAGPMLYYQGRLWYAYLREYTAGDIVKGNSGTAPYEFRDSILKVTENPLAIGGDGFAVPTQAGNIRALSYAANNDKQFGEGTMFIFTQQQVHRLDVPMTRPDWLGATSNIPPQYGPVLRENGGVNDRSVVAVNSDLFFQSLDPAIFSLFTALRNVNQWGNKPISNNINRALAFNDRSLMRYGASGIEFDNYMFQTILPEQRPQGVVSRGIAVLDFNPISTLLEKSPPSWAGLYDGLDVLQLFKGDFGGRKRAFAVVVSRDDDGIELWELTNNLKFDNIDTRVNWTVEFPAYTWQREFDLKRLDGGELWMDKLFGTVDVRVFYRNDANPCWNLWHTAKFCTARTSCETISNPVCYPEEPLREGGKFPITFPVPPLPPCDFINSRPMNIGHQFQCKVEISGWCRIRGLMLYATPFLKQPFGGLETMPGPLSLR